LIEAGARQGIALRAAICCTLATLPIGPPAAAQQIYADPTAQDIVDPSDIIVKGRSAETIPRLVDKLAVSDFGRQVARWNEPICVNIAGMAASYAGSMRQRITDVAKSVKVKVLSSKCRPNVTVQLTADPITIVQSLLNAPTRHLGSFNDDPPLDAKQRAILLSSRVVRWMSITETRDGSGAPFVVDGTNQVHTWSASLVPQHSSEVVTGVIVLIDESKLANVTMQQLSDYVTLVVLARPELGADYSHTGSIMALYDPTVDAVQPKGLTVRDLAFLKGLYSGSIRMNARKQKTLIRHRMQR
jgi:hypothetical protein